MSTIAITEDVTGPEYDALAERWTLSRDPEAWRSTEGIRAVAGEAEAVIVRNRTQVDDAFFAAAPRARVVARAGVGLDNIDLAAADRAGCVVVAPLGANAISVAEHAMTLALALSKRLIDADRATRAGGWDRQPTQELRGKTWGLLSAGATARATARLARAFGMRVLAYDPYVDPGHPEIVRLGIELAELDDVLSAADVLSLHLPDTPATAGLLNADRLRMLPAGAVVISVGRGEVVDEAALCDALESGHLAGAGIDVRASEPPQTGRLERLPNVILTPHVAGITEQSQARIARILCDQIALVLNGGEAEAAYTVGRHRMASARGSSHAEEAATS